MTVTNDCITISEKCTIPRVFLKGLCSVLYFFLLYINDITKASNKINFFSFADDTKLLYAKMKN